MLLAAAAASGRVAAVGVERVFPRGGRRVGGARRVRQVDEPRAVALGWLRPRVRSRSARARDNARSTARGEWLEMRRDAILTVRGGLPSTARSAVGSNAEREEVSCQAEPVSNRTPDPDFDPLGHPSAHRAHDPCACVPLFEPTNLL